MTSLNGSEEASDNSFQTYDDRGPSDATPKHPLDNSSISSNQLPWYKMPELSLSELAFKLKQAEMRVFGKDRHLLNDSTSKNLKVKVEHDNDDGNTEDDVSVNSDLLNRNAYSEVYNAFDTSAQRTLMAINEKYKQLEDRYSEHAFFDNDLIHPDFNNVKEEPIDSSLDSTPRIKKFGCGWCNYKTDSKAHLMRHSKSMHKNVEMKLIVDPTYIPPAKLPKDLKRKHQCDMCSYQTDCKSHLRRHQGSVHCKDKLYECPTCKIEFARSEQAKIHHMAYHPEKHFDIRNMHKPVPEVKKYKLSTEERMEKIKTLFDDVEQFTTIGQFSNKQINDHGTDDNDLSSEKGHLELPTPQKKRIRIRDNNAFTCLKCNFSCRDMWHLKRHVIDVHSTQKDFNCKVCHYATSRAHRLYCHMQKHGELFCHNCDFTTINPEIFKLHSQTCVMSQKSLHCSLCSIDFINTSAYKDHITSHHADEMIECVKCSFITIVEQDMNAHMQSHNWETRVCKLCWHMALDGETLTEHFCDFHAKFDGENKVWVCSECEEKYSVKSKIASHIETHVCSVLICPMELCQFKCSLQSSLDMHLKYIHRESDGVDFIGPENNDDTIEDEGRTVALKDKEISAKDGSSFKIEEEDAYPDFKPPHEEPHPIDQVNSSNTEQNPVPKDTFQGYVCSLCPDRPPFRYKKSFDKHILQHAEEAEGDNKNSSEGNFDASG